MVYQNKLVRYVVTCLLLIILEVAVAFPAYAEDLPVSASVAIGQEFYAKDGKKPSVGTEFNYKLIPLETGIPMPAGTNAEGEYHFKLDGTAQTVIKIDYERVGLYRYEVWPMIEKEYTGYTYDKSVYNLNVYVKNTGADELTVIVIGTNQNSEKVEEILYKMSYAEKSTGGPIKTGDTAMLYQYGIACAASLLLILMVLVFKRKNRELDEL